jgi:HK97 family phage portal protein
MLRQGGPAEDPLSWWGYWYGGAGSSAGQAVNAATATSLPAFNACVALLSSSLAAQRWQIERDLPEGGSEAAAGPADDALALTTYPDKEKLVSDCLRYGTGYAVKAATRGSSADRLVALAAELMSVLIGGNALVYRFLDPLSGAQTVIPTEQLAILRYRSWNGHQSWLGLPPLVSIADTHGVGLAARSLQSAEFKNGTTLRGYLSTAGKLDRQKAEEIGKRWRDRFSGAPGAHTTPVLEEGLTYQEIKVRDMAALQLAELSRLNDVAVCQAFSVPPSSIGIIDRTTRATIEDESRRLVSLCLAPLAARVGDAIGLLLLSEVERASGLRVSISLESLVRGFGLELSEALSRYVPGGILTRNEARKAIGYPGRPDSEAPFQPINIETVDQAAARSERAYAESAAQQQQIAANDIGEAMAAEGERRIALWAAP